MSISKGIVVIMPHLFYKNKELLLLITLTLLIFTNPLKAEIYTWVDKNGKRHYSDSKSQNSQVHTVQDNPINIKSTTKIKTKPNMLPSQNPQNMKNSRYYPMPDVKAIQEKAKKELAERLNKQPVQVPENYLKSRAAKYKHGTKK